MNSSSCSFLDFTIHALFTQTLTALDLRSNKIGPQGAQDLANALKVNKVTSILLGFLLFSLHHSHTFHADTRHTRRPKQWNRITRSTRFCQCSKNQHARFSSYINILKIIHGILTWAKLWTYRCIDVFYHDAIWIISFIIIWFTIFGQCL
jgi:hypothetical protein